jgi:hypothetical protein
VNENEAMVLITAMALMTAMIFKFLDFVAKTASMNPSNDSKPKESAWDDEL